MFKINDITHCWVRKSNLYIVALCKGHPNVMMVFYFLHKLIKVFTDYFTDFHEESLKDNFVITYELLDEMMDHGYPQLTETTVLKEFIKSEAFRTAKDEKITDVMVPTAASNVVSWRPEGIKYKKNEIFLDVIEELNMLCSATGNVLSSEILGSVQCKSMLSGMPELKLGLNDKTMFELKGKTSRGKLIELEDIKFHQ